MRSLTPLVLLALVGCNGFGIPRCAITPTAMTETYVRIKIYYEKHHELPKNLDMLPVREGYVNSIIDSWDRPGAPTDSGSGGEKGDWLRVFEGPVPFFTGAGATTSAPFARIRWRTRTVHCGTTSIPSRNSL